MKITTNITADGTYQIATANTTRSLGKMWEATIFATGTFGSGTVTFKMSPDGGTTKIDMTDWANTVRTLTANGYVLTGPLGVGDRNSEYITLYAVMSGSTNPAVAINVFDAR